MIGTTRSHARAEVLQAQSIEAVVVDSPGALPDDLLQSCDALLDSIPLNRTTLGLSAPQPQWLPEIAPKLSSLKWAGYLSTTAVYGDAAGAWIDEGWPCRPGSERGRLRLDAEQAWLNSGLPAEVFRLAGIYGPERNIVSKLKDGGYKAVVWNPPHWSNRIHVDDIVSALMAAMKRPRAGRIVNLADDMPLPHAEYVTELARLVGAESPELLKPEEAEQELSPMALEFFRDSKRISNRRLHDELLQHLNYPSFRDAIKTVQT